jgi:hypothetical protein
VRRAAQIVPLHEVLAIWLLLGAVVLANFITYARFPVTSLYHVSHSGIAGGASRVLVILNFPIAFFAIALLGITVVRLFGTPGALAGRERAIVGVGAAVALLLCLVAGFPGVVRQSDLDARPINVVPALGVMTALSLTVFAVRRTGLGARVPRSRTDAVRVGIAVMIVVLALPWILADLGIYVADVPGIGGVFMSRELVTGDTLPAVHVGHHHGFDGALFALSALLLTRVVGCLRPSRLRYPLTTYVALMLVYGLTNAAQDFWGEQLVKRGTTDVDFHSVLLPALTPAWGLMLIAVALVTAALLVSDRHGVLAHASPAS